MYSKGSVRPHLDGFIHNLRQCFVFISLVPSGQDFISNVVILIDSCGVLANIVFFEFVLVSADLCISIRYMIDLEYHVFPKTNWPWLFCLVWRYILCTTKSNAARMPIYGSASSTYVSCRLYVRTRFPNTWCILYMVSFACGFPRESGLILITYSCSVKLIFNSLPINYTPQSYVIYTVHGYRTSHVVSTKFSIVIAFLLLYCVISNHPVTGYIIVMAFKIRGSLPFLRIL